MLHGTNPRRSFFTIGMLLVCKYLRVLYQIKTQQCQTNLYTSLTLSGHLSTIIILSTTVPSSWFAVATLSSNVYPQQADLYGSISMCSKINSDLSNDFMDFSHQQKHKIKTHTHERYWLAEIIETG